jgi:hypothetical protein
MTKEQIKLIEYLKSVGFGYAIFAENVTKQGFCSEKQFLTLKKMQKSIADRRLDYQLNQDKRKSRSGYEPCISDEEAMSFGEYF